MPAQWSKRSEGKWEHEDGSLITAVNPRGQRLYCLSMCDGPRAWLDSKSEAVKLHRIYTERLAPS